MGDVIGIIFIIAFIGLYIWSLIWVASDAEARGKSGCLVVLLVALLSWPLGLIVWLVLRPDMTRPDYHRTADEHELVKKAQEKLRADREKLSGQDRRER